MTTSPKTNHAEKARLIAAPMATSGNPAATLALAQVHATLALEAQTARLADEAKTANLIALAGSLSPLETAIGYPNLHALIAARLDLTRDVTP